jgi:hypothetical protein
MRIDLALAEVASASIESVVGMLTQIDPSGTWSELEDDAAIREHAKALVTTGIVDEILTVESVRTLLVAPTARRREPETVINRATTPSGHHTHVWVGEKQVAWGIGSTREAADAAAQRQVPDLDFTGAREIAS